MPENHYKVSLVYDDRRLTLNVFTEGKASEEVILKQAKSRGFEFLENVGKKVEESEFSLLTIQDCGEWPIF